VLPTERRDWPLLMHHEPLTCALIELMQITPTASRSHGVFHGPPAAFDGLEGVTTGGRSPRPRKRAVVVVESRVELVSPRETAAIDNHDDLLPGWAAERSHGMEIGAQLLGITVGHNGREDFGGALGDGTEDAEHHAAGAAAPGARADPRRAFARLCTAALTLAQGTRGEARALGAAPPASPGQGQAPPEGCLCVEHHQLALARAGRQGRECERGRGAGRGVGREPPWGTTGAERVGFHPPRPLSRPRWTPVGGAQPGARSRQRHGEEREPGSRGAGSTRRWRWCASSPVTVGGRPERARSSKPWGPSCAKRCPQ
jgi:hypothetical protein